MTERSELKHSLATDRHIPVEHGEQDARVQRLPDAELLPDGEREQLRGTWERVQVLFVDEPREAVQQAHDLVDTVIERITDRFAEQRDGLMGTWTRGDDVSTEDLRIALQRYRSFFDRLLTT